MRWIDHTTDRILSTPPRDDPFPHMTVRDVFRKDIYDWLLVYRGLEPMKILNPIRPRTILWLGKSDTIFWKELYAALAELKPVLEWMFGLPAGSGYDAQLLHDAPGYSLGPHTDIPSKALTGLFYLPDDELGSVYGTSLYRSELTCEGNKDHAFGSEFERVLTVPYAPNSALFFPCHDKSWHAVEPTPIERWVISYDLLR